jgi:hypothetical protein
MPVSSFIQQMITTNKEWGSCPLERFMSYPTLMWFHELIGLPPDLLMELLCLVGIGASALAVLNVLSTPEVFGACWLSYLSIVLMGQTFLQFQWDALLLEVGFLSIWLAPPFGMSTRFEPPAAVVWALRFVLFKLMLMSGAVKIQSACPTWLGLTALEFHYATQCLPVPTSWFVHQLPVRGT